MEDNEMVTGLIARGDETEKIKTYVEVVEIYISIITMKGQKGIIRLSQNVARAGLRLMVLAPDKVVHAFLRYQAVASAGTDPQETIEAFGGLILSIRKDIVPETALGLESVMDAMAIGE